MIDMHSHYIPMLDDGAQSKDESIRYIERYLSLGFTEILFTPHIYAGYYDNTPKQITAKYDDFKRILEAYFKDRVRFYLASEVYLSSETLSYIEEKRVIPVNGGSYLLFEIDFTFISPDFEEVIERAQKAGYKLIWAHPERNSKIMENPERLKDYIDMDVLVQINLGSLAGDYGEEVTHCARKLLSMDMVHLVGTDCHCRDAKPVNIEKGLQEFRAHVNPEYEHLITEEYPRRILSSEVLYPFPYKTEKKNLLKNILGFFGWKK